MSSHELGTLYTDLYSCRYITCLKPFHKYLYNVLTNLPVSDFTMVCSLKRRVLANSHFLCVEFLGRPPKLMGTSGGKSGFCPLPELGYVQTRQQFQNQKKKVDRYYKSVRVYVRQIYVSLNLPSMVWTVNNAKETGKEIHDSFVFRNCK
jgi:hypothetical protein